MTKPTFQSPEDFMKDYNAYKSGKRYKLMFTDHELQKKAEYIHSETMLEMRLSSANVFYKDDMISVVDLQHKFFVCKV